MKPPIGLLTIVGAIIKPPTGFSTTVGANENPVGDYKPRQGF